MAAMSIDRDALARSVARLERVDLADTGLDAALELIVAETDALFHVDGAGLMLLSEEGVLRYVAASDEPGRMLEALQEQFGEGPCVDAFLEDAPVGAGDLGADPRWPSVGPLAAGHGVHAVLGVPVDLREGPVGTLDVYAARPHRWDAAASTSRPPSSCSAPRPAPPAGASTTWPGRPSRVPASPAEPPVRA